ncbi:MAG: acyl-CoA dehydrogenase family protein [Gammaproteobacteria bacterium]|nr:acyl-CoA dehydrogenase family protein [Gammaproteobacteria bacterium]
MDFELSDEQAAFRDAARQFADNELAPHAARWDEHQEFPRAAIAAAGELGFCGLYTPEEAGGLGLSRLDASIVLEELARGCTSTTAFISIHNMAAWMVGAYANAETREALCPPLAAGETLASYCLTEPGAGSDAAALKTSARKTEGGYVLNGTKAFISGAGDTDVLVVMARIADGAGPRPGASGISAFAVDAGTPGISFGRKEAKLGWNTQATRQVVFEDAMVPASRLLGKEGEGFRIAMRGLDGGRINIAACSVGTAAAAVEQSRAYMGERRAFGRTIGSFHALQFQLADMATNLVASRQMVRLAASKLDRGDADATVYCAMAKRLATDLCFDICNDALQIHGGYGYIKEYPLERYLRDTRVHQILEGTSEIMRVIVARRLLLEGASEIL